MGTRIPTQALQADLDCKLWNAGHLVIFAADGIVICYLNTAGDEPLVEAKRIRILGVRWNTQILLDHDNGATVLSIWQFRSGRYIV